MPFDPDAYLANKGTFNPDSYLASKAPQPTFEEQLKSGKSMESQAPQMSGSFPEALTNLGRAAGDKAVELGVKGHLPTPLTAGIATAVDMGISQVAPAFVGGGAGRAASGLLRKPAEKLMHSSLKPILSEAKKGNAARAVKTLLDEGINVTEGGVKKLRGLIDELNTEIKQRISSSTATVSKKKVADYLDDLTQKFKNQVNPQSDISTIRRSYDEFMNHPDLAGKMDIPVQKAQSLKTGTYKAIGSKAYGELKGVETESQKTLARGLKEQIAEKVPEISGLNAREGELLNALNVTERRVLISANKNPAGLAYLAKNPSAAAAFMADRSELFKSLAARMINHNAKRITGTAGAAGTSLLRNINEPDNK